jgi:pimeloyl-ACP methyl ester carboxylesterase
LSEIVLVPASGDPNNPGPMQSLVDALKFIGHTVHYLPPSRSWYVASPGHWYMLLQNQASSLAAALSVEGFGEHKQAICIAHSFAADLAALVAIWHPDWFKRLIFLCPGSMYRQTFQSLAWGFAREAIYNLISPDPQARRLMRQQVQEQIRQVGLSPEQFKLTLANMHAAKADVLFAVLLRQLLDLQIEIWIAYATTDHVFEENKIRGALSYLKDVGQIPLTADMGHYPHFQSDDLLLVFNALNLLT